MKSAYRVPNALFPIVQRFASQEAATNTPITEMVVNSIITSPARGPALAAGQPAEVKGLAWDGGYGIARVDVSTRRRPHLAPATLGQDLGRFSFRPWSLSFSPMPGAQRDPGACRPTASARPRSRRLSSTRPATSTTSCPASR